MDYAIHNPTIIHAKWSLAPLVTKMHCMAVGNHQSVASSPVSGAEKAGTSPIPKSWEGVGIMQRNGSKSEEEG